MCCDWNRVLVFEARSTFVTECFCKPVAWADESRLSVYVVSSLLLTSPYLALVYCCGTCVPESRKFGSIWVISSVAAWVIEQDLGNVVICEQGESIGKPVHQIILCLDILGDEERTFIGVVL